MFFENLTRPDSRVDISRECTARRLELFEKTGSNVPRKKCCSCTYTSSIRGPLLPVFTFSFIWTVGLFRSDMLYIFTWFSPCFQCKDTSAYPHFSYRDNGMIFRMLFLLSQTESRLHRGGDQLVVLWIGAHPDYHHHEHSVIENCLFVGCSILRRIHSADETQPDRNSCPEFAFSVAFSLDSIMSLSRYSFLRSVSLAVVIFGIYGGNIITHWTVLLGRGGGGTTQKFGWGCASRSLKALPQFTPKYVIFLALFSDLTQNSIPCFRPDP